MVYRFMIVSDEVEAFRRDVCIDGSETFLALQDLILQSVGYESGLVTNFTLCDEGWEPREEVSMIDEMTLPEEDLYLMHSTKLEALLGEEHDRLMFTFDILGDRSFYIELREISSGSVKPGGHVVRSEGAPPPQQADLDELLSFSSSSSPSSVGRELEDDEEFLDEEFYGTEIDDYEEFSDQGYDISSEDYYF